jgi:hypothetical protein
VAPDRARPRARLSRVLAGSLGLALVALTPSALATPSIEAHPAQGERGKLVDGWNELVVTLHNTDQPAWSGEVFVDAAGHLGPSSTSPEHPLVTLPISIAAGEPSLRVHLPFFARTGALPSVRLRNQQSGIVASLLLDTVLLADMTGAIVELHSPAFGEKLREPFSGSGTPGRGESAAPWRDGPYARETAFGAGGSMLGPSADVVSIDFAKETGDPILPETAGGWSGASLVVTSSEQLARMPPRPLEALDHFVLSGGWLAVWVNREEDLRAPAVVQLLGTQARSLGTPDADSKHFAGDGLERGDVSVKGDDGDVARHGLGRTWLLREDPWRHAADTNVGKTIYGLWWHAVAQRSLLLTGPAGSVPRWNDYDGVRNYIDPNQAFRPALGAAAVMVGLYSLLVGPIAFWLARRRGRPLIVLRMVPALALALFVGLVVLGRVGKGLRSRARKLALVDVGAGEKRGTATTFHGFFVGDPSRVSLSAQRPSDMLHTVEPSDFDGSIDLDRNGIAVHGVRAHAWETAVLSDETVRDLGGRLVIEGAGGKLSLVNETPLTLEHVILHPETTRTAPARSRYFASLAPGKRAMAADGIAVERRVMPAALELAGRESRPTGGPFEIDRGSASAMEAFDGLAAASAMLASWEAASSHAVALPEREAIATAVARLPHGTDGGIAVERDVLFIRVVGLGGGKSIGELPPDAPTGKEHEL